MKIGVLETGLLRESFVGKFPDYPQMFDNLLALTAPQLKVESCSVINGDIPGSPGDCDGWLITGSRHGVYEELPWMQTLGDFIRDIADAQKPLFGICFGHQIIAQSLGGNVVKSDKGWGIGLHQYELMDKPSWISPESEQVGIYAFHQDQVVDVPPDARTFLSSDFCEAAGLLYGDHIASVQGHPEFMEDYEHALIDLYEGDLLSDDLVSQARQGMSQSMADTAVLSKWMTDFFINR